MTALSRKSGTLFLSLLLSLSLLVVSGCVEKGGGPHDPHTGPARLRILGGDTVNWGKIAPGSLKDTIEIVNAGGDTLRIKDVHASCGCTTAPIDKKEIGPGDTAHIAVTLDAQYKSGELHKSLTVTSNDSTRPSLVIPLLANIQRDIAVTPEVFPPVLVRAVGAEGTSSVVLRNTGTTPVTIEAPTLMPSSLLVNFDMTGPRTLAPNDSMSLTARVKVLKEEGGTANFSLATSSKLVPKIELSVSGQLERNLTTPGGAAPGKSSPGAGSRTSVKR